MIKYKLIVQVVIPHHSEDKLGINVHVFQSLLILGSRLALLAITLVNNVQGPHQLNVQIVIYLNFENQSMDNVNA